MPIDLSRKPILDAIYRCMQEDPSIILFGEGMRAKARYDYPLLLENFGDRVYTGPIAEAGMVNMALGASVTGLRPVVDLIFNDLLLRAMDEILNHVAKIHIMSGGKLHAKMVIKTEFDQYFNAESGSRWDYLFAVPPPPNNILAPELRVAKPRTVKESVDMMYEALHYDGPTLFFEDRWLEG